MGTAFDSVRYVKPNMAALKGESGRRIINTILNTPKADFTKLNKESEQVVRRIKEAQNNGTY